MQHKHAFTLIELLVVISVIALLISILLPVLGAARDSAKRTKELSAARMITAANRMWIDDHDSTLFKTTDYSPPQTIRNNYGDIVWNHLTQTGDAGAFLGYSWRLAPYFDYNIEGALLINEQAGVLNEYEPSAPTLYNYLTGDGPSFGMNFYMGEMSGQSPLYPYDLVYERQVQQPSGMLIAASARNPFTIGDFDKYPAGFRYVSRPTDQYYEARTLAQFFGYMHLRWDQKAVIAYLDGHADMMGEQEINDTPTLWDGSK
ncbi:MAG: type II secretion system protein [Planctomycetota bacterium]